MQWGLKFALGIWAVISLILLSVVHSWHWVTYEAPSRSDIYNLVGAAINPDSSLAPAGLGGQVLWRGIHVLKDDCQCSQRVLASLAQRAPTAGFTEAVVWLSDSASQTGTVQSSALKALMDRQYVVHSAHSLKTVLPQASGLVGAPTLIVLNANQDVVYVGGYNSKLLSPSVPPLDHQIMLSLKHGTPVADFPIYGCALNKNLTARLDPLGMKSWDWAQIAGGSQ